MREPRDPLHWSNEVPLQLNEPRSDELERLKLANKEAVKRACMAVGEEQEATATREQDDTIAAIEQFWREVAAEQIPEAAEELKAWMAWRQSGGKAREVSVELGNASDLPKDDDERDEADDWKR